MRDSDDDDIHDRDYDVAALANNLSQAFRYKIYGNEDNEEVCSCWPLPPVQCMHITNFVCAFLNHVPFKCWTNVLIGFVAGAWQP
jgi:hypothetical protein